MGPKVKMERFSVNMCCIVAVMQESRFVEAQAGGHGTRPKEAQVSLVCTSWQHIWLSAVAVVHIHGINRVASHVMQSMKYCPEQ